MKTLFASMTALILGGFLSTASATSYAPPEDQAIPSPNGKFTLKITANTGEHRLMEGDKVLWSFKRDVWHDQYFVSNDGKHVLWVAWKYVKLEDAANKAIVVYSAKGEAVSRTYAEASKPRAYKDHEIGPIGDFWRIWREMEITREGDVVTIKAAGKGDFVVDLSDLKKITEEG